MTQAEVKLQADKVTVGKLIIMANGNWETLQCRLYTQYNVSGGCKILLILFIIIIQKHSSILQCARLKGAN